MKRFLQIVISSIYSIAWKVKNKSTLSPLCHINSKTKLEGCNKIGNSYISNSLIGYASYLGDDCKLSNCQIGRFCSIGSNVKAVIPTHPLSGFVSMHPAFFSVKKQAGFTFVNEQKFNESIYYDKENKIAVKIGNDVWIGDDVIILGGVNINDGAAIATGAIVTKDVPPYSVVGGIPAKIIKYRFCEEDIEFLLSFKWWNKEVEWIRLEAENFKDIEDFKKNCRPVIYGNGK